MDDHEIIATLTMKSNPAAIDDLRMPVAELFAVSPDGARIVHRRFEGVEAYDYWHRAHYFREIIEIRRLLEMSSLSFEQIPRKEKDVLLHCLLEAIPGDLVLTELGSSMMEIADGLRLVEQFLSGEARSPNVSVLSRIKFQGIETSEMFRRASALLHADIPLTPAAEPEHLPELGVVYDRAVSSYAFSTVGKLTRFLNGSRAALLNLFVSESETFHVDSLGPRVTYFSLPALVESLRLPLHYLFGDRVPGGIPSSHSGRGGVGGGAGGCKRFFSWVSRT